MTIHEIIRHYTQKVKDGEIEYSQIRNELQYKDLDDEAIHSTLKLIDAKVQRELEAEKERRKGRNDFFMGLIALTIGIIISGLSMLGFIGNGRIMIVTLGLISFGALKMFQGMFKMKA